jgi:hypothetical protein
MLAKILNATFGTGGADAGATAEVAPNTLTKGERDEGWTLLLSKLYADYFSHVL